MAVLVPVLDEAANLRCLLPRLVAAADEVIVCDGGSGDGSPELASRLGARVVSAPQGRGTQLNRAAEAASADVLLFLHADTRLPPDGIEAVRRAVARGERAGGFLVRFDSRRLLYRVGARVMSLRTRLTRVPLGDQAQFVERRTFQAVGGFREWPILEDLDLIRRLKRSTRIAVLPLRVETSARRFQTGGPARTVARNWLIWALYFSGVSPQRLARLYRRVR